MTAILEPDTAPAPTAPAPAPAPSVVTPPVLVTAPAPAPAPEPVLPGRVRTLLTSRWDLGPSRVRLIGLAILAMIVAVEFVEPPADGPDPVHPVWLETLYTVQSLALLAAAAGFLIGRRWALRAAVVFAGIGAFNVAMCPVSGHHVLAVWWFGEVALAAAMLALPALALRRSRPRH